MLFCGSLRGQGQGKTQSAFSWLLRGSAGSGEASSCLFVAPLWVCGVRGGLTRPVRGSSVVYGVRGGLNLPSRGSSVGLRGQGRPHVAYT